MVDTSHPAHPRSKMLNKISLAPMVRMNTLPFRMLAANFGADYVFSEEIIDKKFLTCVRIENELLKTIDYVTFRDYSLVLRIKPEEKERFILQIGTNHADIALKAVEKLLPDIGGVDVNMGCPKKFSVQGGMGSALMRDLDNAKKIMSALVERFGKLISVSCKIRVLRNDDDTLKYVLAMQEAGVHWISIHPRTAAEESRVPAKWYLTKSIIDSGLIKIPVLGSGDLFSPLDIHKFLSFTGAQGVILARGAIHNPAIFKLKERMLNLQVPLIASTSTGNTDTENEDDWKDNTVKTENIEKQDLGPKMEEEELKEQPKGKKKGSNDEESIEFSQNLVKVYERRYSRFPMEIDIIEQVREYFRLSVETGNHYQNTKYCIMYMLKTHKHHFELFKQIHGSKTLSDYARVLGLEHLFEQLSPEYFHHFDGTYYKKNKALVDSLAERDGLIAQSVGQKRDKQSSEADIESAKGQFEEQNQKRVKL